MLIEAQLKEVKNIVPALNATTAEPTIDSTIYVRLNFKGDNLSSPRQQSVPEQ